MLMTWQSNIQTLHYTYRYYSIYCIIVMLMTWQLPSEENLVSIDDHWIGTVSRKRIALQFRKKDRKKNEVSYFWGKKERKNKISDYNVSSVFAYEIINQYKGWYITVASHDIHVQLTHTHTHSEHILQLTHTHTHTHTHTQWTHTRIYIYIYIYIWVCMCMTM